jgi:hypothetical protein
MNPLNAVGTKVGDNTIIEVLHPHELAQLIRAVDPKLTKVEVQSVTELEPWMMCVSAEVSIRGEPTPFATIVDARGFLPDAQMTGADKIMFFVSLLNKSFEKASGQVRP